MISLSCHSLLSTPKKITSALVHAYVTFQQLYQIVYFCCRCDMGRRRPECWLEQQHQQQQRDLLDDGCPRNAANARERARMRVLSKAFGRLKTTLPWVPADTKLSKLDTLRLATTYIAHLSSLLATAERSDAADQRETTTQVAVTSTQPLNYAMVKCILIIYYILYHGWRTFFGSNGQWHIFAIKGLTFFHVPSSSSTA